MSITEQAALVGAKEIRALRRADRKRQDAIHVPGETLPMVVFGLIWLVILGTAATFLVLSLLGVVHR